MRTLSLGDLVMRLRLHGMDNVRELHSILDEENRNVVTNDIPVTLGCIHLQRETTDIPDSVCTALAPLDS